MPFKKAFKRVFRPVRKIAKKIIPKEVKPFLPYIAAGFGPATAGLTGTAFAKAAMQKALIAAATSAATDEDGNPLRAGLLSITPDITAKGLGSAGRALGNVKPDSKFAQFLTSKGTGLESTLANPSFMDSAKIVGGQTAIDQTAKLAEINQDEIDEYNRKLREQGITDAADRRKAIRDIYLGVGYTEDYVDGMLDRYGYKKGGEVMAARMSATKDLAKKIEEARKRKEKKAYGGRIGLKRGGIGSLIAELMQSGMSYEEAAETAEDYYGELEAPEDIKEGAKFAEEGFKSAFGVESLFPQAPKPMGITPGFGNLPRMADGGNVMSPEEYFKEKGKFKKRKDIDQMMREYEEYLYKQKYGPRDSAAEGGLMNLGGKEMDLRGGGFVPIGKKEKADDVPARLSKNEFVMTADAVRAAGGGSVNKGAKRMYDVMNKLEARA